MTLPDADTINSYGGQLSDYGPVVDPSTDRAAADANKAYATVAMGSRMVPRVEVAFAGHATTPTLTAWEAVWKGATATAPTPAHSSTGVYTITLPTSVNDELAASHSVNLQRAWGQVEGSTAYHVQCTVSANVITARIFDMAGVANDAVGATIVFWAR